MSAQAGKRSTKTVKLTEPITLFDKQISTISIKAPRGALYGRLGEPRTIVFNSTGSGYYVEREGVVLQYIDELIDHEQGDVVYSMLCLEDAKAVKEELFDFFTEAEAKLAARKSTRSSSDSAA